MGEDSRSRGRHGDVLQDEAFDGFFRREYQRLVKTVFVLTGDLPEAENIAQEAMARICERWARVGEMASPTAYLYRVAFNLNKRRFRGLRARRYSLGEPASEEDPALAVEKRDEAIRILKSIPRRSLEALILTEWVGLGTGEAGEVLGIQPASVRVLAHRARMAIRERMAEGHV